MYLCLCVHKGGCVLVGVSADLCLCMGGPVVVCGFVRVWIWMDLCDYFVGGGQILCVCLLLPMAEGKLWICVITCDCVWVSRNLC